MDLPIGFCITNPSFATHTPPPLPLPLPLPLPQHPKVLILPSIVPSTSILFLDSLLSTSSSTGKAICHISRGARNLCELDAHRAFSAKTSLAALPPRYLTLAWCYYYPTHTQRQINHHPVPRSILSQLDHLSTSPYHHIRQTVRLQSFLPILHPPLRSLLHSQYTRPIRGCVNNNINNTTQQHLTWKDTRS